MKPKQYGYSLISSHQHTIRKDREMIVYQRK